LTQAGFLSRRFVLLLPVALAACGEEEPAAYDPLRYNYLPPIQLNVASIDVQQRFIPAGVAPDVSGLDPDPPIETLKAMANDRLQAFGTVNKAVFAILDASMARENDVVTGSFAVSLTILDDSGAQLGFAEARVQSRHTGQIDNIRGVLYEMTKAMMSDMNVEFEYQIRKNLKAWLTSDTAPPTPVEQTPLDGTAPGQAPPDQGSSSPAPSYLTPPDQAPSYQAPPYPTPPYPTPSDQTPFGQPGTPQ
jgi:hypothetical protein